eukprot:1230854-Alexandrium_andersonii.AAC.1
MDAISRASSCADVNPSDALPAGGRGSCSSSPGEGGGGVGGRRRQPRRSREEGAHGGVAMRA